MSIKTKKVIKIIVVLLLLSISLILWVKGKRIQSSK